MDAKSADAATTANVNKRARAAAVESQLENAASVSRGLAVGGRVLPWVSERAIYELLAPDDIDNVFLASKSLKSQVIRFLSSMRKLFCSTVTANEPCRLFLQLVAQHCVALHDFAVYFYDTFPLPREGDDRARHLASARWTTRVLLRNSNTLRSVCGFFSLPSLAVLQRCHNLERFEYNAIKSIEQYSLDDASAVLQRMLTLHAFPRLTALFLHQHTGHHNTGYYLSCTEPDLLSILIRRTRFCLLFCFVRLAP